jgi:hypothetical protein
MINLPDAGQALQTSNFNLRRLVADSGSARILVEVLMSSMHLIGFPNRTEHKRAIVALLEVLRAEYLGLPGYQMVVTDEHIKALEHAQVRFKYLSKAAPNGPNSSPVRS